MSYLRAADPTPGALGALGATEVPSSTAVANIPWKGATIRVKLKSIGSGKYLFAPAADKFAAMVMAANEGGVALKANTAFRDTTHQARLYNEYLARGKKPPIVALPGTSDHERGISVDVETYGGGSGSAPVYAWLQANASKYGFTNDVPSEPWHWTWKHNFTDADVVTGGTVTYTEGSPGPLQETVAAAMKSPSTVLGLVVALGLGAYLLLGRK